MELKHFLRPVASAKETDPRTVADYVTFGMATQTQAEGDSSSCEVTRTSYFRTDGDGSGLWKVRKNENWGGKMFPLTAVFYFLFPGNIGFCKRRQTQAI